jgi:hypothetical protein
MQNKEKRKMRKMREKREGRNEEEERCRPTAGRRKKEEET